MTDDERSQIIHEYLGRQSRRLLKKGLVSFSERFGVLTVPVEDIAEAAVECDEPAIVEPRPISDPSVRQGDLVIDNDGTVVELT